MAIITTVRQLDETLQRFRRDYLELQRKEETIARNAHMNKLKGRQPEFTVVERTTKIFLNYTFRNYFSRSDKVKTIGCILAELENHAKAALRYGLLSGEEDKAIVADFLNYVAAGWGRDLGLYTHYLDRN